MPATYSTAVKSARMTAVRDAIDGGTGPGVIEIGTAGMAVVLAIVTLEEPCGSVAGPVLTLAGMPHAAVSALASGVPAEARIRDGSGTDIVAGLTVGLADADLLVDAEYVTAGQGVIVGGAAITHV